MFRTRRAAQQPPPAGPRADVAGDVIDVEAREVSDPPRRD
jgi:hypothetical protein